MSYGTMDLAPLLCIISASEWSLLLLIHGLLVVISAIFAVLSISPVSGVDLLIILLAIQPLATRLQKSSLGLRSLYAYINNYEQINHHLGFLHGYLFHGLDITDPGRGRR
jgi:hypothetical protein